MATSRCPSDGSVGEDLLMEILVRLPFKSLARFQCVSKSWQRLISGNYFRLRLPFIASGVLLHEIHRGDRTYTYACVSDDSNVQDGSASLYPWHETSTMIDGCNGLLLYYAALPTAAFHVVNPTTRRWAALPLPRSRARLSVVAFDPCSSPHYRVVCFTGWRAQGAAVEVFDSGVGAWREREVRFGLDADAMSATMHYFGGALHVLAYSGHDVRIDLATLECTVTALPAPVTPGARVGHCLGRVRYACGDGRQLKIWELRDEWVLTHAVSVGEVTGEETGSCEVSFLGCHPEREVVYLWVPWKLVVFDLEKRRVEKEWIFGSGKGGGVPVGAMEAGGF